MSCVELSNWGEIFLNKELVQIMAYAYKRNVALYASNGVNLNDAAGDVLEALVKYRFQGMSCSIDGAGQDTYAAYRVRGDFHKVINNIRTINEHKTRYRSRYPVLHWQFIPFGHNEHEIGHARKMAEDLNMSFQVKLAWDDLYTESFSPVRNLNLIRNESGLGVATRAEFKEKYGYDYAVRKCCLGIWDSPQINYDGRVLGCSVNYWGDYGNAFEDGLAETLNNERIDHAREMLMGKREAGADIPCTECKVYAAMRKNGDWIERREIGRDHSKGKSFIFLENKLVGHAVAVRLARTLSLARRSSRKGMSLLGGAAAKASRAGLTLAASVCAKSSTQLTSAVHPLKIPLPGDAEKGWKAHAIFEGATLGMEELSCHASVLDSGHCPHPPHAHTEEEFLLLLSGEVDLLLARDPASREIERRRLTPGRFVYYPANFAHTLETTGETPASYMMFKWRARSKTHESALAFGQFDTRDPADDLKTRAGLRTRLVLEGPTEYLRRIQCHTSMLAPGAEYPPHVDDYDVAIVVLEGEVETFGKRAGPFDVIFCAAGEPHGMSNPGADRAKYIVFEFQGRKTMYAKRLFHLVHSFLTRILHAKRTTR